jgi:hypothetical protein
MMKLYVSLSRFIMIPDNVNGWGCLRDRSTLSASTLVVAIVASSQPTSFASVTACIGLRILQSSCGSRCSFC